jgi:hypothetical protein
MCPFSAMLCADHPIFTSLDVATIIFFTERSQTPNLEHWISLFMSLSDRVAQLYSRASGSLFITFYDLQGYGRGIQTCLHTGDMHVMASLISSFEVGSVSPFDYARFMSCVSFSSTCKRVKLSSCSRGTSCHDLHRFF